MKNQYTNNVLDHVTWTTVALLKRDPSGIPRLEEGDIGPRYCSTNLPRNNI